VCVLYDSYRYSCRKRGACGAPLGAVPTIGRSARSNLITPHLITFRKFHSLTGVNWKFFGNVPVLGTLLRNLETPFGGAVHKADETHKVLRSALPFTEGDFQFLSSSQRKLNLKLDCTSDEGCRRPRNTTACFGRIRGVNWKGTGNHLP